MENEINENETSNTYIVVMAAVAATAAVIVFGKKIVKKFRKSSTEEV
jgi:hypothetical protein